VKDASRVRMKASRACMKKPGGAGLFFWIPAFAGMTQRADAGLDPACAGMTLRALPAEQGHLLLLLRLVLPMARSLWALLFWLLTLAPLLPASARLMLPLFAWPRLPRLPLLPLLLLPPAFPAEEEDFEDAIACSLVVRPAHRARGRALTLGAKPRSSVGVQQPDL
jgi:hypothetical protein